MDTKYKSHSFVKLWIATTMFMLCCFATGTLAQDAVAADTVTTVVETTTEITAAPAETDAETPDTIGELALGLNTVWMLLAAMLVFFMQPGFALVEAGFTRVKNTANILMKNFVDFMFGSLLYWFIGFGLMFGCQENSSECPTSSTFLSWTTVFPEKVFWFSRPYSVQRQPQSYQEQWQNVPNSPCIWFTRFSSVYDYTVSGTDLGWPGG